MRVIILVVAMILSPSWLFAGWFGPSTYEECILKEMKGVTSNQAAGLIATASCRGKFPEKSLFDDAQNNPIPVRDLSQDEIAKITGSLTCFQGDYLSGTLHNGNNNVSTVSATIYFEGREYDSYINISPLSTSDIKLKIVGCKKSDSAWSLLKAQGI